MKLMTSDKSRDFIKWIISGIAFLTLFISLLNNFSRVPILSLLILILLVAMTANDYIRTKRFSQGPIPVYILSYVCSNLVVAFLLLVLTSFGALVYIFMLLVELVLKTSTASTSVALKRFRARTPVASDASSFKAIVYDSETVQDFTEIFSKIMIGEFKGFDKKDYDTAVKWTSEQIDL